MYMYIIHNVHVSSLLLLVSLMCFYFLLLTFTFLNLQVPGVFDTHMRVRECMGTLLLWPVRQRDLPQPRGQCD